MSSRRIQIDIVANAGNTAATLQKVGADAQKAASGVKTLGPALQGTVKDFNSTGAGAQTAGKAVAEFGGATEKSKSKLKSFGDAFKGNRGMVFGVAGLSSALAEAVGMMGMLDDTQQRAAEAQANLNLLQQQGVTTGQELAQAEAEVTKQNRFLNMVTRNTVLSQMDMVFFTTMVINGLMNNSAAFGKVTGAAKGFISAIKGMGSVTTAAAAAQTAFSAGNLKTVGSMSGVSTSLITGTAGMTAFGGATDKAAFSLKAFIASAAGVASVIASVIFAFELIREMEDVKKNLEAKGHKGMTLYDLMFGDQEKAKAFINDGQAAKDTMDEIDKHPLLGNLHKGAKGAADPIKDLIFSLFPDLKKAVEDTDAAAKNSVATQKQQFDIVKIVNDEMTNYSRNMSTATTITAAIIQNWNKAGLSADQMRGQIEGVTEALKNTPGVSDTVVAMIGDLLNAEADKMEKGAEKIEVVYETIGQAATAWAADQKLAGSTIAQVMPAIEKLYLATGKSVEDTTAIVHSWIDSQKEEVLSDTEKIAMKKAVDVAMGKLVVTYGKALTEEEKIALAIKEHDDALKLAAARNIDMMNIEEQRIETLKNLREQEAQRAAEIKEITDAENTLLEVFGAKVVMAKLDGEQSEKLIDLANSVTKVYEQEEIALAQLAAAEGIHINNIHDVILNEQDQTTEMRKGIAARINWNKVLEDSIEMEKQISIGYLSGVQALQSFVNGQIQANAHQEVYRQGMEKLSHQMFPAISTTNMTTEAIQGLVELGFKPAQNEAQKLADRMAGVQRAMDQLSGITQAEDKKAFKDAWKELDLGSIPKKLRDDYKSLFDDLRKANEKGREASTGLAMVTVALNEMDKGADDVSLDEIHETMDKVIDDFEKYAKTGQDLQAHNLVMFEGGVIMDDLRNKTEQFKTTQMVFNDAMANGKMDGDDYIKMMTSYLIEAGRWNEVTDKGAQLLIDQGVFIDQNKNGINDLEEATKDATTGLGQFNDEMAQIEATAIVADTVKQMWADAMSTMIEQTGLMQQHWALSLILMEIDALVFKEDMVTYFETDIPTAVEESITALSDMSIALLGLIAIMGGTGGGDQGSKLTKIFGGGGVLPDMPDGAGPGGNQGNPLDPDNLPGGSKSGFEQLRIGEGGGGQQGGLVQQWATMLAQLATQTTATVNLIIAELLRIATEGNKHFTTLVQNAAGSFNMLAAHYSQVAIGLIASSQAVSVESNKIFSQMVQNAAGNMNALGDHWASKTSEMAGDTKKLSVDMNKNFKQMTQNAAGNMNSLASHWSSVCNSMIRNAKSAASGIKSALKSIPDEEVLVKIRKVNVNKEGGIHSFAEGGVVSAAQGITTSNGPTSFLYGDNSGGRETLAFIPHNDPDDILDLLDRQFGRNKNVSVINANDERPIIVPITLNINGEQYSFTQRYRIKQGHDIANQVI